jgi:small subunit ribosomal protein S16
MVPDTDARVTLKGDRVDYWLSVGALPTEKVKTLIKKYGTGGTHVDAAAAAREKASLPREVPPAEKPVIDLKAKQEAAEAEAKAAAEAKAQAEAEAAEAPAEAESEASSTPDEPATGEGEDKPASSE